MTDDQTLDRRSFLQRTSAAGLVGLSGVGSSRGSVRRDDSGPDRTENQDGGQTRNQDGGQTGDQDGGQNGAVEYFQAVLPSRDIIESNFLYQIVVVGDPIQPGVRPPPLCFPGDGTQWRARDAVVVKPTETTGLFGSEEDIGAISRTRVHLERPVESETVYRISGGEYCDGYARVTVHELPPRLSEYFNTDMIDQIVGFLQDEGNETAGNGIDGDGIGGNETAGNEITGDGIDKTRLSGSGTETR